LKKATDWATNGYAVTYVAVDGDETVEKNYSRIANNQEDVYDKK